MNWLEMVDALKPHIQPGDVILFHSPLWPWQQSIEFEHYLNPFRTGIA